MATSPLMPPTHPLRLDPAAWRELGMLRFQIQGDVMILISRGLVTLDDMRRMFDWAALLNEKYLHWYLLIDATLGQPLPPHVRRFAVEHMRSQQTSVTTLVAGASILMRAAATMSMRAIQLFRPLDAEVAFVADIDAGFAWIAAHKRSHARPAR